MNCKEKSSHLKKVFNMTQNSKKIWTAANIVTIVRIVCVPVWLLLAELVHAGSLNLGFYTFDFSAGSFACNVGALSVFIFFVLLALTDKLDGYLARSRGEVTVLGKFLDPIADKILVMVALCFLLEYGFITSWILVVVVCRELLVSALRMMSATSGIVIAASWLGKWKTAVTLIAICTMLFALACQNAAPQTYIMGASQVLMICAALLTIWSGVDYFLKFWQELGALDV